MLKKLLKYDLLDLYKGLIIFYSLSVFFGILTRIFLGIENSAIMNIIGKVCSGAVIAMIFNILINNLMRSWVRFKQNLYGDESYLTHTLPVEKRTLYLSKILASIITSLTSMIVIAITLFIAYYSKENIEMVKNMLLPLANTYDVSIIKILIAFVFILFLEFANMLQTGFTGIILGHRMNNNKTAYSVLYGFIIYMIAQTIGVVILFIIGLCNSDIMNLFFTNEIISVEIIKSIIYISMTIYASSLIILYFINSKLFSKGVNVD